MDWPSYGFAFGRRLRFIRRFRSLTQEQLAHLSGMHRNEVGNLERNSGGADGGSGAVDPHLSTVYRLAGVLDVPPALLLPDGFEPVAFRSRDTADDIAWARVEAELVRRLGGDVPEDDDGRRITRYPAGPETER